MTAFNNDAGFVAALDKVIKTPEHTCHIAIALYSSTVQLEIGAVLCGRISSIYISYIVYVSGLW